MIMLKIVVYMFRGTCIHDILNVILFDPAKTITLSRTVLISHSRDKIMVHDRIAAAQNWFSINHGCATNRLWDVMFSGILL
jgi:hypothetical protein